MKLKLIFYSLSIMCAIGFTSCADNSLDVNPDDQDFPLQLVLDAEEGAGLPDAEDYALEVKFADHIGSLPARSLAVAYSFDDVEGDMSGVVEIDKIIYEYEDDDCTYERSIEFTKEGDGQNGSITIPVDPDLGTIPESFEIVFKLPGLDDTEGSFAFTISELTSSTDVSQGYPRTFEYEVLDSDVAGEWELEISDEEQLENFKRVFGYLNSELEVLAFNDITGKVVAEFEFGEMKFVVELVEEEEVVSCKDGEIEIEVENEVIEIEADYEVEDGEIKFEGSHLIVGDDGEITDELDFQIESEYEVTDEALEIRFIKVVDEDNFQEGEELLSSENGIFLSFLKD